MRALVNFESARSLHHGELHGQYVEMIVRVCNRGHIQVKVFGHGSSAGEEYFRYSVLVTFAGWKTQEIVYAATAGRVIAFKFCFSE